MLNLSCLFLIPINLAVLDMKSNYSFIIDYIQTLAQKEKIRVLDYGCGNGTIVQELIEAGFDAYGCEYFGPGSGLEIKKQLADKGLLGNKVHIIEEINTGFEDDYFDVVISNQVFEHIPNIEPVLHEIHRVMKANAIFLNVFPHKGTIREAHCHILFAHRLTARFGILYAWLYMMKSLGLGRRKKEKNTDKWVRFWMKWIPENTNYISRSAVLKSYKIHFTVQHIEDEYFEYRLKNAGRHTLARILHYTPFVSRYITRKWGGLVLLAKPVK